MGDGVCVDSIKWILLDVSNFKHIQSFRRFMAAAMIAFAQCGDMMMVVPSQFDIARSCCKNWLM